MTEERLRKRGREQWQTDTQQKNLLEGERLSGKVTLFAKVTILPGDELPYHEHHGETEVYHILSGEGIYQDNTKHIRCRRA